MFTKEEHFLVIGYELLSIARRISGRGHVYNTISSAMMTIDDTREMSKAISTIREAMEDVPKHSFVYKLLELAIGYLED